VRRQVSRRRAFAARLVGGAAMVIALVAPAAARAQAPAAPPRAQPTAAGSPPPFRVTWQQALDLAAARNPSAAVAVQEIARADALVSEARAGWLPLLNGNASYVRLDSARAFGGTVTTPISQWNANVQLTVPLLAPVAWANDWHAQDTRTVATMNAADVRRQLAASVGRVYLVVLLQHRQLEVALRARDTARAHYDYAHTRLLSGLGNGVDDARSEQELRSNEALVKDAETALVRAQSALAILLSEEDLVDASDDVTLAAAPSPEAAFEDARKQRADVRVLEARRTLTDHLRRDEWVYYAPTLLAQATGFRQTETPLQPGRGWQAALVLSIPLFDGGARSGIRQERTATDEEARVQLEAGLRQVSVEVRTSFKVVANSDESLRSARAAAAAANTAAVLADKSYRAGASTNLEVVDAERRARDAASQVALAEDAARQARLDLLLSTGAFP
jgi:outer membrane protein